jgi:hypothetical protein
MGGRMIVETLQQTIAEVNGLWDWITGIIAGWGLTFTIVVVTIVYAHVRINRLIVKVRDLENRLTTEDRDISLRLRKLER